ncbi:MAG TPA: hypothetical protein VLR89_08450 [Anaerolineaceae bacterium]|nr:hypothetical protein [Anaerolineaceae bacterium]
MSIDNAVDIVMDAAFPNHAGGTESAPPTRRPADQTEEELRLAAKWYYDRAVNKSLMSQ